MITPMAPRVIDIGTDTRGSGRWAWTRLQGKSRYCQHIYYVKCLLQVCKQITNNMQELFLF